MTDRHKRRAEKWILPISGFGVIALIWEFSVSTGIVRSIFLPPPTEVLKALVYNSEFLLISATITLRDIAVGFFIGSFLGVGLGILIGRYRWLDLSISPILLLLSPIPIVTFIPLFIIWFGLNLIPVFCCSSIAALFPSLMSTISGVRNVDNQLIEVAQNFEATDRQILKMVVLPAAMPQIANGLRLSIQLCFLITPVAEMIMGDIGMGGLIWRSADLAKTEMVILGQITLGIMGLILYKAFDKIETHWLLRWKRN